MLQGIQTNFPHENLRKYGCYFFALLQWAEIVNPDITLKDTCIMKLFDECKEKGWIEDDCFVVNPVAVLNHTARKVVATNVRKATKPPTGGRFIVYMKKPSIGHFVLSDNGVIWDSWNPSAANQGFPIDSYRVLE